MRKSDFSSARWRKSSHSGGDSGMCVEIAQGSALIGIRDSKDLRGGHLIVDRAAFAGLLARVKAGDLDL